MSSRTVPSLWGRGSAALLASAVLGLPGAASAQRQIEVGVETFVYRTATTPLNRENILGADEFPGLARLALGFRESHGSFRAVFRGYVGQDWGIPGSGTRWVIRQAHAQYWWGEKLGVRGGKQRIGWGSGFAWNPTNRLEPPKNPLNTALEQEGVLGLRLDWVPASWASVAVVGTTTDATPRDLPFAAPSGDRRNVAALRAQFLVKDTDVALVASAGKNQRTLFGVDVGRGLGASLTVHAEAAVYQGAEMLPPRDGDRFFRIVAGALNTTGQNAFAFEYFYNGEGYSDAGVARWLSGLDRSWDAAGNPELPVELRRQAFSAYALAAGIPYGSGLGLRRHYLHFSWTNAPANAEWSFAVRTIAGLSDGALAVTPGVGFSPRDDLTVSVDAVLLLGPEESEYRLAPVKGGLQTRLKWVF